MTPELSEVSPSLPGARTMPWPHATSLAAIALYGPQLLMCLYTLVAVSCSHCKLAVWQVAPVAPGLFIYEWGRRLLNLPHFSSGIGLALCICLSLAVLMAVALGARFSGRGRVVFLGIIAAASGLLAFALLGAIRS